MPGIVPGPFCQTRQQMLRDGSKDSVCYFCSHTLLINLTGPDPGFEGGSACFNPTGKLLREPSLRHEGGCSHANGVFWAGSGTLQWGVMEQV